jgi:hypothetical protein
MKLLLALITLMLVTNGHAIINGVDIETPLPLPARSLVALKLNYKDDQGRLLFKKASGVIIGKRTVLTAGHNLFYMQSAGDIEVIFSHRPSWGKRDSEIRIIGKEKFIHPNFKNEYPMPPRDDIALLILESEIPEGYEIAQLPNFTLLISPYVQVYGFGMSFEHSVPPLSDFRLRATSSNFKNSYYELGSSSLFWTNQKTSGFCGGDSGGPAFFEDTNQVVGIASYTDKDAEGKYRCLTFGGFVDVVFYLNWIKTKIR